MRNISFSLTTRQIRDGSKTVTRRLGWEFLKPGDQLQACEKVMGRRHGEPLVKLCVIEVVSVRREPLYQITPRDVTREGFHGVTVRDFIRFFCDSHERCRPSTFVTRIEFSYPMKTPDTKKRTGAALARGKSKQDYATPPDFIAAVTKMFGPLAFDLAADATNTKAPVFYSKAQDSLQMNWHQLEGTLWLNPPFDNIEPWARKCAMEFSKGARILFLTPASVGSNWFVEWVNKYALVLPLNGRIHFDPANPTWGYPKDCMLSCYGWGVGFRPWRWPLATAAAKKG